MTVNTDDGIQLRSQLAHLFLTACYISLQNIIITRNTFGRTRYLSHCRWHCHDSCCISAFYALTSSCTSSTPAYAKKSYQICGINLKCRSTYHHHQARAPSCSVAISTRCFQCSWSWTYFQAKLRPRLWGWRSAPRVRSHVWRGRPGGRFQSVGRPRIDVLSALEMSSDASILATWPNGRSRLLWIN